MNAVKAYFHNGIIDFIEQPCRQDNTKVLVIFPEKKTAIRSLRGAIQSSKPIDYTSIASELHHLSQQSKLHIQEEADQGKDSE